MDMSEKKITALDRNLAPVAQPLATLLNETFGFLLSSSHSQSTLDEEPGHSERRIWSRSEQDGRTTIPTMKFPWAK
jgi:hypothetical protein